MIIGAGPAGLSCAYELTKQGVEVEIFESAPQVGGLCRTFELWGQKVDVGPHRFFSSDPRVVAYWRQFTGPDPVSVRRMTRILYRGNFFDYPLKLMSLVRSLSIVELFRCGASYLLQKLKPPRAEPSTFAEWVTERFGSRLFNIFFKTYTEKVWGIPCAEIDSSWASQRIKSLSVGSIIRNLLRIGGAQGPRTLLDRFIYPQNGAGSVYENMAKECQKLGVKVHLSKPVREFLRDERGNMSGVRLSDGQVVSGSAVVSTMPLTLAIQGLGDVPSKVSEAASRLFFRNTVLVYLEIDSTDLFQDNWIYIHSPELQHGRITNFRNWSPGLSGSAKTTILCLEYWCFDSDALWQSTDAELKTLATSELRKTGLLPENIRVLNAHTLKVRRSYPVYQRGFAEHLNVIQEYLDSVVGLITIGRAGSFKYNNQDHSILMGLMAADQLLTQKNQNLWNVNSDQEYQEYKDEQDGLTKRAA